MTQYNTASPSTTEPSLPPGPVPDPGSRTMAWIFALISIVCIGIIIFLNQFSGEASSTQKAAKAVAHEQAVDLADPFTLAAKMVMKLAYAFDAKDRPTRQMLISQSQGQIKDPAKRPEVERVREAIMHADIMGPDDGAAAAESLFQAIEQEFVDRPDRLARALEEHETRAIEAARADIATLRKIYAGQGDSIEASERERLIQRHEWFGKVAFTFGKPHGDPKREELLSGGVALVLMILGVVLVGFVAVFGGIACFIVMIILIATGRVKRRFVAPAPGGSFGWEILGAFVATFLGFKAVGAVMIQLFGTALPSGEVQPPSWFGLFAIGGQWLVALAIFFPLLRGVRFSHFRRLVGWTAPRGFFREVFAGIFGYMAGLPLLFAVVLVTLGINAVYSKLTGQEKPPDNPILELVSKGNPLLIFLLFTLATIWAPIVEETVFRGGLYRALRGSLPMFLAAVVSALAFGFMHGYFVLLLGPVITIGFILALVREWRGSIIGPMAAHALNNATILGLVFFLFKSIA